MKNSYGIDIFLIISIKYPLESKLNLYKYYLYVHSDAMPRIISMKRYHFTNIQMTSFISKQLLILQEATQKYMGSLSSLQY